jgi:uncharacterized protein (TIGR02265 family)
MMEEAPRPTIKGIFVKSHIRALERERGAEGISELHKRVGRPLNYMNADDVPIADEVAILGHIVDMTTSRHLAPHERELEAGRLHFRNFATTPLWAITDSIYGGNQKKILMHSQYIAGYVFQDVTFVSEDTGPTSVKITMYNNDYPLEHFQGFFEEWLLAARLIGTVQAAAHGRGRFEYAISWSA